jgi:predicted transcriptional regulator
VSRESSANPRRPSGGLEGEVLAALWAAAGPLTPRAVQADLAGGLAYTTVMTTLSRLHEKGAVSRERVGRAYAYTPVLDQAGIAAARMRELLDAGGDRAAVLARFVGSLSGEDEVVLAEVLEATADDEQPER